MNDVWNFRREKRWIDDTDVIWLREIAKMCEFSFSLSLIIISFIHY